MDNELLIEMLQEEVSNLTFMADRHLRWSRQVEDRDVAKKHRAAADILKEAIESNLELIEMLKGA
jgi:hypothetical protein